LSKVSPTSTKIGKKSEKNRPKSTKIDKNQTKIDKNPSVRKTEKRKQVPVDVLERGGTVAGVVADACCYVKQWK